jgi:NTP pyrophosphatase (non-canonical NTP hydrolase)
MTLNEYQEAAARTINPKSHCLQYYALGLGGEAGEVLEIIKKAEYHEHQLNTDELKKEIGDALWYISMLANKAGFSLEEIARANIEKLKARYPNGFETSRSINREGENT